jgi:1-acyl-sn-glycerol-3-phosphate acyltransferase
MFAYLRSIFHYILGFITATFWILLIGFVSLFVPTRRYHELWRFGFLSITHAFGLKIIRRGVENIDASKGVIYMSNHVNSFEPFIAMPQIPQWVVAVEKQENFKLPIYGILIQSWGNIAIDRKNRARALEQLDGAKQVLASGTAVAIMPEGTRSRDGSLNPFKKGGFFMAIDTGATIIPYAYKGLYDFNHHGSFLLHPRTIEVIFTAPIDASQYTVDTMPALMARVRQQILEALGQTEEAEATTLVGESGASLPTP